MMKTYLGLDGGGTHTRCVWVDAAGTVLGEGEAGSSNYHNVGIETAIKNLKAATEVAMKEGKGRNESPSSAFLGCAGIKSSTDKARLTAAAEAAGLAPAGEIVVENDLTNALAGGLNGRPGIALIAGTGSHCLGRNEKGENYWCGGWGWLLDDQGSAMGLSLEAFRVAVRSADGRRTPSRLLPAVLAFLGLTQPEEILARLHVQSWTPDELAAFAPVLMRCAEEGDRAALSVLKSGAVSLATMIKTTVTQLKFPGTAEVILLGGCARSGAPYQPLLEAEICKACPSVRIVEPEFSTRYGAALNALRCANLNPLPPINLP